MNNEELDLFQSMIYDHYSAFLWEDPEDGEFATEAHIRRFLAERYPVNGTTFAGYCIGRIERAASADSPVPLGISLILEFRPY